MVHVLVSSANYPGSDYYRVREPARSVNEADLGVTASVVHGLATTMVQPPGVAHLEVGAVDDQGADVVVLQLPGTREMLQIQRILQARGVAVVVEIDDMLSATPASNPAFDAQIRNGMSRRVMDCAREADLVTVTTPVLLKEYAPHGRGMVVPNAVPRHMAELPPAYERETDAVSIGWSGSVPMRPFDLQEMGSGLQQALDRTPGRSSFTILGQAHGAKDLLHVREEPVEIPWVHGVEAYAQLMGESFDIGVAPVRDDRFNSGKSWLKVLEYAARGVYTVRSASVEYDKLGLGRRARTGRDWAKHLLAAIEDPDHRREVAQADRDKVLAGHLSEHTAPAWAQAWLKARDNRTVALRRGA